MSELMNRLRGDRVIVDLTEANSEKKTPYNETKSGIYVPTEAPKEALLIRGVIVRVGHEVDPKDLSEGQVVYVRKMQGDRLDDKSNYYLFRESAIIGND